MRTRVWILSALLSSFVLVSGCSTPSYNGKADRNHMLQVFTGGAVGQVVAGNVGGFIVGSFITDIVKTAKIQYEDMQLENGEEAANRLKHKIKQAEEKKPEEKKKVEEKKDKLKKVEELLEEKKKAEQKKEIDRKVEEKVRELEKKADEQKQRELDLEKEKKAEELREQQKKVKEQIEIEKEKKAEEIREKQKQAEEQPATDQRKKAEKLREQQRKAEETFNFEKRAELFINDATITPQITGTGGKVEASVNYTLLGPETMKSCNVTETRILTNSRKKFELDRRELSREQGTYVSRLQFVVSEDMPTGYCTLYTTISDGEYTKTVKSEVIINK